eukprot:9603660-Lingulodinium_polyedra.AAC.1
MDWLQQRHFNVLMPRRSLFSISSTSGPIRFARFRGHTRACFRGLSKRRNSRCSPEFWHLRGRRRNVPN